MTAPRAEMHRAGEGPEDFDVCKLAQLSGRWESLSSLQSSGFHYMLISWAAVSQYYFHLIEVETKPQQGEMACPGLHNKSQGMFSFSHLLSLRELLGWSLWEKRKKIELSWQLSNPQDCHRPRTAQRNVGVETTDTPLTNLIWVCCYCSVMSNSFETPWTVGFQALLSMGFPRQEYWSGLPFPLPRDLPDPGIESVSPALQIILYHWATWEAQSGSKYSKLKGKNV